MKLYEIPNGSYFKIVDDKLVTYPYNVIDSEEIYWLGNIDGMYSYSKDSNGNVIHISAYSDVEMVS